MILKRVMENTVGPQGICTKVIIKTINGISMERCSGQMEVSIEVNGLMEYNMVTEK